MPERDRSFSHLARWPFSVRMAALTDNLRPGFFHDHAHPLQGRAGADDVVVHNHGELAFDIDLILLLSIIKVWRRPGGDGKRFGNQRSAHVGLVGFCAGSDIGFFRFHRERIRQRDGFGFGGYNNIERQILELLMQGFGAGLDQFGISKDVEDGDLQAGLDIEIGAGWFKTRAISNRRFHEQASDILRNRFGDSLSHISAMGVLRYNKFPNKACSPGRFIYSPVCFLICNSTITCDYANHIRADLRRMDRCPPGCGYRPGMQSLQAAGDVNRRELARRIKAILSEEPHRQISD